MEEWLKDDDVRSPPLIESNSHDKLWYHSSEPDRILTFDCVNCARPVLAHYLGTEKSLGGFGPGVDEELLVFERSCQVVISGISISLNGNVFYVVSCRCNAELGFFVVVLNDSYNKYPTNNYWVRSDRVRARVTSREMKMMEFVNEKARSVLSQLEKKRVSSGELKSVVTPEFRAAAGDAAVDVAKHFLANYDFQAHSESTTLSSTLESDRPPLRFTYSRRKGKMKNVCN